MTVIHGLSTALRKDSRKTFLKVSHYKSGLSHVQDLMEILKKEDFGHEHETHLLKVGHSQGRFKFFSLSSSMWNLRDC